MTTELLLLKAALVAYLLAAGAFGLYLLVLHPISRLLGLSLLLRRAHVRLDRPLARWSTSSDRRSDGGDDRFLGPAAPARRGAPRGSGSTFRNTSPNCPAPPVCFLCRL